MIALRVEDFDRMFESSTQPRAGPGLSNESVAVVRSEHPAVGGDSRPELAAGDYFGSAVAANEPDPPANDRLASV
jgi:hypothetical protein